VPSRWTTPEEFEALVSVLHEVGRGTLQCSEGSDVTIPHLARMLVDWGIRLCDPGIIVRPDHSERVRLDVMDPLTKSGYEWYPQIGVLPTTFEVGLENPFMFAVDLASVAMRATPLDELFGPLIDLRDNTARIAVYRDPEFRRRFAAETDTDVWNRNYWPWVTVSLAPSAPQLEGRSLVDVAAERAMSPAEVMLDLSIDSDLEARFAVVAGNQDEDVVMDYFHNDTIRLGKSDAGAHVSQLCDARYPTNLLGRWVREKGLAMERAVRMLTSMEAECYGIFERGALVEGWHADVTVFDPETVIDGPVRRVRDLPAGMPRLVAHAVGIEHVIVNGIPLREGDRDVVDAVDGPLPGQVLRHYHGHRERVLGPVVASR
jgi:N-acyl-D-aspartate/D-glutamate deacylase